MRRRPRRSAPRQTLAPHRRPHQMIARAHMAAQVLAAAAQPRAQPRRLRSGTRLASLQSRAASQTSPLAMQRAWAMVQRQARPGLVEPCTEMVPRQARDLDRHVQSRRLHRHAFRRARAH